MEIIYRELADLIPNPKNPRKSTEAGLEDLAKSIERNPQFFEARPVLLSDRTGVLMIIAGERRTEAAAFLGMKKVPTILMTGLTEEQEDEIMVRDNTHQGLWDDVKLQEWDTSLLHEWGAPGWSKIDEEALNSLFEAQSTTKVKRFEVKVSFPQENEENREEIVAAISSAISERFPDFRIQ